MMNKSKLLYLLQNQDKYFLSKHNEWVDGTDLKELFKTPYRDVAVNQLFEVNAHDYTQRIHIIDCEVQGQSAPIIDPDLMPPPLPKKPAAESTSPEPNPENAAQEVEIRPDEADPPAEAREIKAAVEPEQELLVHEV